MFVKMPRRSPLLELQQPTSLRRSPRLHQLSISPKTPNPTSKTTLSTPISTARCRKTSSRKPTNGPRNSAKSSVILKENVNWSVNCGKPANGSLRKANLGSGTESIRRSSRFCKQVSSETNADKNINGSVAVHDLSMLDIVACPITPVCARENIGAGFSWKDDEIGVIDSSELALGKSERRITRSCSRILSAKVEYRKIGDCKLQGNHLLDSRVRGRETRKVVMPVRGARGKSNGMGKEDCNDSCRVVVCGLEKVGFDALPRCATPGRARRCLKGRCELDSRTDDLSDQMDVNFERRITRASKLMARKKDLSLQGARIAAQFGIGVGESKITKQERQKKSELVKCCRTRSRKRVQQDPITSFSTRLEEVETAMQDNGFKKKDSHDCVEQDMSRNVNLDVVKRNSQDIIEGPKLAGVKRKRKQAVIQGTDPGWTKDQEMSLQRAYFTAKPSPHFWKKVAKLVPGKSAQECFDKMHSFNLTPVSTRQSSRVKKQNSPSEVSLLSNDLFKTIETKSKKTCKTKRKSHVARKNVRHLLHKYCEDNEPDLFSILEPAVIPAVEALKLNAVQLTPKQASRSPGSAGKYRSLSSSGHKKPLSRLSGLSRCPLASPPVLKKVKNMALHEKYIDQLHVREDKRKVVSGRHKKSVHGPAQVKDVIKAAKDALVSDARDVIEKFRHSQANIMDAFTDSEEASVGDDDGEDDVVL